MLLRSFSHYLYNFPQHTFKNVCMGHLHQQQHGVGDTNRVGFFRRPVLCVRYVQYAKAVSKPVDLWTAWNR